MIIKVCGMRDLENIRAVQKLGIDWMGFVFVADSPRYVRQISSRAGTIPDYSSLKEDAVMTDRNREKETVRVGVFMDDMPQNIVTRVVNYRLDVVQLHGDESPVMMENLRKTLAPDISPGIKLMKTIYVGSAEDFERTADYAGIADFFLFEPKKKSADSDAEEEDGLDWNLLQEYRGDVPFIVGGRMGMDDVERICTLRHPHFYGINVSSCFEKEYAVKDIDLLKAFLERVRGAGRQAV